MVGFTSEQQARKYKRQMQEATWQSQLAKETEAKFGRSVEGLTQTTSPLPTRSYAGVVRATTPPSQPTPKIDTTTAQPPSRPFVRRPVGGSATAPIFGGSVEEWVRKYDPHRVETAREDVERARAEYEAEGYRMFGPQWYSIVERLSYENPRIKAFQELSKKQGGLTPEQMAEFKRVFREAYGVEYDTARIRLPYIVEKGKRLGETIEIYTTEAGPLIAKGKETEAQLYNRVINKLYEIEQKAEKYPELYPGVLEPTKKMLESVKAAHYQQYGPKFPSEQLAEKGLQLEFGLTKYVGGPRPVALSTAVFFGEFEKLEITARQLLGQPLTEKQKYRQPVDIFSVWGHPKTAGYSLEEKIFGTAAGGGAAIYLQSWAAGKIISPAFRVMRGAVAAKFLEGKLLYYAHKTYGLPLMGETAKIFQYGAEQLPRTRLGQFLFKSGKIREFFAPIRKPYVFGPARATKAGEQITLWQSKVGIPEREYLALRDLIAGAKSVRLSYEVGGPVTPEMVRFGLTRGGKPWSMFAREAPEMRSFALGQTAFKRTYEINRRIFGTSVGDTLDAWFATPKRFITLVKRTSAKYGVRPPEESLFVPGLARQGYLGMYHRGFNKGILERSIFIEPKLYTSEAPIPRVILHEIGHHVQHERLGPRFDLLSKKAWEKFARQFETQEYKEFTSRILAYSKPTEISMEARLTGQKVFELMRSTKKTYSSVGHVLKTPPTKTTLGEGMAIDIRWGGKGVPVKVPYETAEVKLLVEPSEEGMKLIKGGEAGVEIFKPTTKTTGEWAEGFLKTMGTSRIFSLNIFPKLPAVKEKVSDAFSRIIGSFGVGVSIMRKRTTTTVPVSTISPGEIGEKAVQKPIFQPAVVSARSTEQRQQEKTLEEIYGGARVRETTRGKEKAKPIKIIGAGEAQRQEILEKQRAAQATAQIQEVVPIPIFPTYTKPFRGWGLPPFLIPTREAEPQRREETIGMYREVFREKRRPLGDPLKILIGVKGWPRQYAREVWSQERTTKVPLITYKKPPRRRRKRGR